MSGIQPRTIVATVEIQATDMSIATLRGSIRTGVEWALDTGKVRQVRIEVIQGTRAKKKARRKK